MAVSIYLANKLLEHSVGDTAYTMPTAYVSLFTSNPTDAGTGTEASYAGYARVVTSGSSWSSGSGKALSNTAVLTCPSKTSGADVTLTHFALYDALTGGNLLHFGPLTTPKIVQTGDPLTFAVGALSFTLA